uniref:Uncharacterized protein n=1 Tax=Trichogramma kaykai TaxID=54128 RepID=A0ABD2WE45_9HYME
MLHELPDYLRKKHTMLIGLWVAKQEPDMTIFLQPFVNQANKLSEYGFKWNNKGKEIMSKLFPITCCVDSPARCAMLNMKRFNGIHGCTYCEYPTVKIDNVRKYPMIENIPKLRTDESVKRQMAFAYYKYCSSTQSKQVDVLGVWGPSALMNLKHFNIVSGMIVDFLHACLVGLTELHTNIIFSNVAEEYYVGDPTKTHLINQRLLSIKPPTCVGKTPRGITERNNWKASEWLTWLLYYSIPCLSGLTKKKYIIHLSLFVRAMNILLSDSITPKMLHTANELPITFVFQFGQLYGNNYMHYNVHRLLHLRESVKNWGPLWAISTFPFENENKLVLRMKKNNSVVDDIFIIKMEWIMDYNEDYSMEEINDLIEDYETFEAGYNSHIENLLKPNGMEHFYQALHLKIIDIYTEKTDNIPN